MKNTLILALSMWSLGCLAQSAAEEAILLNQELEFLEDSISSVQSAPIQKSTAKTTNDSGPEVDLGESDSLERTYFKDSELDEVRTRTAAPKRRSF